MSRYTTSGTVNTVQQINSELEKIQESIGELLSKEGDTPNAMNDVLDMNSNRIINTPNPVDSTDVVNKQYVDNIVAGGSVEFTSDTKVYSSFAAMVSNVTGDFSVARTTGYYTGTQGIGAGVYAKTVQTGTVGDTDGGSYFIDTNGTKWILVHNNVVSCTQFGVKGDGTGESSRMNAFASFLNPNIEGIIDVPVLGVDAPILFNTGFKKISATTGFEAINLLNGLARGTEVCMFGVNMTEGGIATNRTTGLATITSDISKGDNTVTVNSTTNLSVGMVICLGNVTCQITEITNYTTFKIDRNFPYDQNNTDNSLTNFTTVDRLTQPNIGAEFSLGTVKGNGTTASPRYGYGVRVSHCFKAKFHTVHGLYIASKVFQDTRCADCVFSDMSGNFFTDTDAGHGYVYRGFSNDTKVYRINGTGHRHVVDFTFAHRCQAYDCKAFYGIGADYLTHFNGCSYCDFINCDIWYGEQGYGSLSDPSSASGQGRDYANRVIGGTVYNSRFSSRENDIGKDSTKFIGVRITAEGTAASSALLVPRAGSVFNFYNCRIDSDKALVFGDVDYTINMYNCEYINRRNFGMSGEDTTGAAVFNFTDSHIDVQLALSRRSPNNRYTYKNCVITALVQPWQEDAGDIEIYGGWCGYDSSVTTGSRFWLPIQENDCILADVTLSNILNPYRFYTGTTAGTIRVGNNTLIDGSVYSTLNNLNWTNVGDFEITESISNQGSPLDGTEVKITDWDTNTGGVFLRKRVTGSWVDGKLTTP